MKNMTRIFFTSALILFFALQTVITIADPPDPPPPPGGHGTGGNAAAPIDGGLSILLALGAGYGSRKIYRFYKEENKIKES